MRASAVILMILLASPLLARACTIGTFNQERDLRDALQTSELAFVARLSTYAQLPPDAGSDYFMGRVGYVLVEAIKGRPAAQGALFERTGFPAREGVPPGVACGPWVATRRNEGALFLIFATRETTSGRLRPHPLSLWLNSDPEASHLLAFVKKTQLNLQTP